MGVGGYPEHLSTPAGGKQNGFGVEGVNFAGSQAHRHHARATPLFDQQVQDMILIVEMHLVLDALLVTGLQNHVSGAVRGVTGPAHGRLAVFLSMPAERPLRDFAVRRAAEGQPPVLQVVNGLNSLAAQDLRRVLVNEVVAALDRIEHVPFPVVLLQVPQRRPNAALGCARVRPRGIQLAQNSHLSVPRKLQSRHQARAPSSHNHRVVTLHHCFSCQLSVISFRSKTASRPKTSN